MGQKPPARRLSMAAWITLPYLAVMMLFVLLIGMIGYISLGGSLDTTIKTYASEVQNRIASYLEYFFRDPLRVTTINAEQIASGVLDPSDRAGIEAHLVAQIRNYPWLTFAAIALPDGGYIGASRSPEGGDLSILEAGAETGGRLSRFAVLPSDRRGELLDRGTPFDGRLRPWYSIALGADGPVWYPVYKYVAYESLGLGCASIARGPGGKFAGVVAGDVALTQISAYLASTLPDPSARTFIVGRNHLLLASSTQEALWKVVENDFERIDASASYDPVLRAASTRLPLDGPFSGQWRFSQGGESWIFNLGRYYDPRGLDLGIGVVLREAIYTSPYRRIFGLSLAAILGATALLILVGFLLGRTLARPAIAIRDRASRLAKGDWGGEPLGAFPTRELDDVAKSFETMATSLRTTVDGLESAVAERTANLESLLHEVHHRIKNNLGVASSLLTIQSSMTGSEEAQAVLAEAGARIQSMALLYDKLYKAADVREADAATYLGAVIQGLRETIIGSRPIELLADIEPVELEAKKASPIGIIVTELVTNSCKYAFPGGRPGTIRVTVGRREGGLVIRVEDDGVGFPPGFSPRRDGGFGLTLTLDLARQLEGSYEILPSERGAVSVVICKA